MQFLPVQPRQCKNKCVTDMSSQAYYSCAVTWEQKVLCWNAPTNVPSLTIRGASRVATGWSHVCVLFVDGRVECFGTLAGTGPATPPVNLPPAVDIVAGYSHTCVVLAANRSVYCFGMNDNWQLEVPPGVVNVTAIDSKNYQTCVVSGIAGNGSISCWGGNGAFQYLLPFEFGGDRASLVATGWTFWCATSSHGKLYCEGIQYPPISTVRVLGAGLFHACASLQNETVTCWGVPEANKTVPPDNLGGVTKLTGGWLHTCALHSGRSTCWGTLNTGAPAQPPMQLCPLLRCPSASPTPSRTPSRTSSKTPTHTHTRSVSHSATRSHIFPFSPTARVVSP
jgi:hypothetical protein